jgi:hypothetical protein
MFPCFGSFTGDFHPIYNAPMLGAHNAIHRMATRVTLPASRFAPMQEARHGQPSVIADVGYNMTL